MSQLELQYFETGNPTLDLLLQHALPFLVILHMQQWADQILLVDSYFQHRGSLKLKSSMRVGLNLVCQLLHLGKREFQLFETRVNCSLEWVWFLSVIKQGLVTRDSRINQILSLPSPLVLCGTVCLRNLFFLACFRHFIKNKNKIDFKMNNNKFLIFLE